MKKIIIGIVSLAIIIPFCLFLAFKLGYHIPISNDIFEITLNTEEHLKYLKTRHFYYEKESVLRIYFIGLRSVQKKTKSCSLMDAKKIKLILSSARKAKLMDLNGIQMQCIHNIRIEHFINRKMNLDYSWSCDEKELEKIEEHCSHS